MALASSWRALSHGSKRSRTGPCRRLARPSGPVIQRDGTTVETAPVLPRRQGGEQAHWLRVCDPPSARSKSCARRKRLSLQKLEEFSRSPSFATFARNSRAGVHPRAPAQAPGLTTVGRDHSGLGNRSRGTHVHLSMCHCGCAVPHSATVLWPSTRQAIGGRASADCRMRSSLHVVGDARRQTDRMTNMNVSLHPCRSQPTVCAPSRACFVLDVEPAPGH